MHTIGARDFTINCILGAIVTVIIGACYIDYGPIYLFPDPAQVAYAN